MRADPARFIRFVGWAYLVAAAAGVLVCAAQLVVLSRGAPGLERDTSASAIAVVSGAIALFVLVASIAFLKRRRWARFALMALTSLGIVAGLIALLAPSGAVEPTPPDSPAGYPRLLRLVSMANVFGPLVACVGLGWILWRLRSPAMADQFR